MEVQAEVTPEGLGLQLVSTVVGRRGGFATINGRAYAEREIVRVANQDGDQGEDWLEFRLVKVLPRAVLLERGGKQYQLQLPEIKLANGRFSVAP